MKKVCVISLSLLLLLALGTEGMVTLVRNQCKCQSMSSASIPLRRVINFEVFPVSPSCDKIEYIVTLRQRTTNSINLQQCLDPSSEKVQKMYKQFLASRKSQASQPTRRRPRRSQ